MKNILGIIVGFALGVAGFLWLFKLIILDTTLPSDELAPGIVIFLSVLNGILFAFIVYRVQQYFVKKRKYKT